MRIVVAILGLLLAGCGALVVTPPAPAAREKAPRDPRAHEVVLYALSLVDIGYRFGGKNPSAGLDCSGMVSYVFERAANMKLVGSAAEIARKGRPIEREGLEPGDLVFFDTRGGPHTHVGIYVGDKRFVHAPSENGRVRIDRLDDGWFASRFTEARTYFD
ncbi:MAG: NlpC/P60 family protein [Rhodocyclaceae bacterium]|nr:NlpC/P60 family protein [Rhodocyclaceae bacterium]